MLVLPVFDVGSLFVVANLVCYFFFQLATEHTVFAEEVVTSMLPVFFVQGGSGSIGQHRTGIQLDDTRRKPD